ncbi:MAG: polysaccharide pyruvyl transferase family protein, partial [Planctomycetota bacterium]
MGALAGLSVSSAAAVRAAAQTPRTILLRSSWQTVNIGDIGHTPGLLHLIEKHLPEVQTILWPVNIEDGVEELLRGRFPKLRIVKGSVEGAGRSGEVREAFDEADLMLHGSGPSIVAANALE